MKILILKRDKLGDLLLTTPLFALLREHFPHACIDLLASDYNGWVAAGNPHLDRIFLYRRVRIGRRFSPLAIGSQAWLFARLLCKRYDFAIVAQGEDSPRAVTRALWTGAKRVISYAQVPQRYGNRLTDALVPPAEGHEAARLLALLEPLGIRGKLIEVAPTFVLPQQAATYAAQWLKTAGLTPGQYIVLGLGARRARKQPTATQLVRWVERIHRQFGLSCVFMWTPGGKTNVLYPGDDAIAEPILQANPVGLVPFRGPLIPALGLIWNAKTSIFPDSGLMHFASASPGGVLGLFGDEPDFAQKWRPLGPRSRHLVAPLVASIDDETVFEALGGILESR